MPDEEKKANTICARNKEGTLEASALLWRALCADKTSTLLKYLTPDAILTQPDRSVYSPQTEPSLKDYVNDAYEPWTAHKIHGDPDFVEVDMMSSALLYKVTVWRMVNGEMKGLDAICSSVFRQGPGGDWRCCVHHMSVVDEEEEEYE